MNRHKVLMIGNIIVLLLSLVFLAPFIIMILVSLQTMKEIYSPTLVLLPDVPQFSNFLVAMGKGNWGTYFFNSFFITAVVVMISLIINSMTGYTFARVRFKGRKPLFLLIMLGLMIPPQATLVPVFIMLKNFPLVGGNDLFGVGGTGFLNTYSGLIIQFVAGSFGVFLCRQYYMDFPVALDEAAKLDGCGRFRAYIMIYLPLSMPILASLGSLKAVTTWNEYTWPLVFTNQERLRTVQLALTMFKGQDMVLWNELMAATLLVCLPLLILYIFAQKYFVEGMVASSVKY